MIDIKHIFFDLDHTLWDFELNSELTYTQIFSDYGIDLPMSTFLEVYVPLNMKYWKWYRDGQIDKETLRYKRLKDVFDHYGVSYPILIPRNFGMIINKGLVKRIEKIGLDGEDLFRENHELKALYLEKNSNNEHLLDQEKLDLAGLFDAIRIKAAQIDKSLEGYIGAEGTKAVKALENVEKRLKKALENQNETAMSQIDGIREKLFPGGGLQERHDNFLNFYINNPELIRQILEQFDPFDFSFYQFWEE